MPNHYLMKLSWDSMHIIMTFDMVDKLTVIRARHMKRIIEITLG